MAKSNVSDPEFFVFASHADLSPFEQVLDLLEKLKSSMVEVETDLSGTTVTLSNQQACLQSDLLEMAIGLLSRQLPSIGVAVSEGSCGAINLARLGQY